MATNINFSLANDEKKEEEKETVEEVLQVEDIVPARASNVIATGPTFFPVKKLLYDKYILLL